VDRLLEPRVVWVALVVWALTWAVLMSRHGGVSWHYFRQGGLALVDGDDPSGSMHVYATHPELQFGPVALALAAALVPLGVHAGMVAAQILGAVLGLVLLAVVDSTASLVAPLGSRREARLRLLVVGVAFLPVWMNLAVRFVHIDDVLALVLVVAATRAAVSRRPTLAALLLGLAAGAKPWALPFLVLALALRPPDRLRVLALSVAAAAAVWLPFVLSDPASVLATRFVIPTSAGSSLPLLGVHDAVTPWWDRPAQLMIGAVVAWLAVRRGRWAAAVLLVVSIRVALDPGSYSYYTAGLLVGAVLWDLLGSRLRFPWWSVTAAVVLFAARWSPLAPVSLAWLRILFVVVCLVAIAVRPRPTTPIGRRSIVRPSAALRDPLRNTCGSRSRPQGSEAQAPVDPARRLA
jgi:hypothetical protein